MASSLCSIQRRMNGVSASSNLSTTLRPKRLPPKTSGELRMYLLGVSTYMYCLIKTLVSPVKLTETSYGDIVKKVETSDSFKT